MRREERRDGIRAAITLESETSDEAWDLGKRLQGCTIEGRIEIAERLARRVLADAGLPTVCGAFKRHADGSIERVADDTEQVVFEDIPTVVDLGEAAWVEGDTGWRLVEVRPRKVEWAPDPASWRLVGLTDLAGPAPSITHDAAMLLGYADAARDGIAGGCDPVELVRRVMRLGETFEALRLSIANGWRLAETGHKVGDPSRKHRGPREKPPEPATLKAAAIAKMHREPTKPLTEIATAILKEKKHRDAGVSHRTLRRWLGEERKKHRPI